MTRAHVPQMFVGLSVMIWRSASSREMMGVALATVVRATRKRVGNFMVLVVG